MQSPTLRAGATQVTAAMVDEVYRTSEKMIALHQRIDAFVRKDWRALQRFDDIPWDYFRQLWNPPSPDDDEPDTQATSAAPMNAPPKTPRHSGSTKTPRKPRATKANLTPAETLSPAHIKAKQFQDDMVQQIAQAAGGNAS
ncbi:hypothetical protein [Roseateles albus]|uniref:Uncharacterized protein n=1 Tax=Roseateles albus TaxID=2987525 RepID=A0ABT5KKV9_9BURK|nr:hypothetical protein [Roseateles albus]MDC8774562.1 hypothetical protein [Roseateles albus]